MVTFAYPWVLAFGFSLLIIWLFAKRLRGHVVVFRHPLTDFYRSSVGVSHASSSDRVLLILRALLLSSFIFLAARPQLVDNSSRIVVDGVDIVMALDVSRSMELVDDPRDLRTRIEISKQEAVKFIDRRTNDALGIVVFGADALSLCPLTFDKKLLKETVNDLLIGKVVSDEGTFLGAGLATSVNRLRASKAKSKVVILLTDGCPTQGDFFDIDQAIELAKLFNIKVYAIGTGSSNEAYVKHPSGGLLPVGNHHSPDMNLLKKIAERTGGMSFEARKSSELEKIYKTIDELEKTKKETLLFSRKEEVFLPFAIAAVLFFVLEFMLRFFWWRFVA